MSTAFVRPPTPALARCALTFVARTPIDVERAVVQHRAYVRALEEAGARVVELPAEPPVQAGGADRASELPDGPFVEDTAVLLDGIAVLARPADPLRRLELPSVERALSERVGSGGDPAGSRARIRSPGVLEGGDVLRIGRRLFVGLSGRTSEAGLRQLAALAEPHGYEVTAVRVSGALHLKTAVTHLPGAKAAGLLLANPDWVDLRPFRELDPAPQLLPVPPEEPFGANTLTIGETLLVSAALARTRLLLERRGLRPRPLDLSEFEKAEAGLTCLSLRTDGA